LLHSNNTRLLSTGNDGVLRVYDISDPNFPCTKAIGAHRNVSAVNCCALHRVNCKTGDFILACEFIVTGSSDNTLRVWKADSLELLGELCGHNSSVNSCACFGAPDAMNGGTMLELKSRRCLVISGSSDMTLKLWDLSTLELLGTMTGHTGAVNGCVAGDGGTFALSASGDFTVKCWCLSSFKCIHTFTNHRDKVSCVASLGPTAVSGGHDGCLHVYDLYKVDGEGHRTSSFRHVGTYLGHEAGSEIFCCAMFRHGTRAASAGKDRAVHVVDLTCANDRLTGSTTAPATKVFKCMFRLSGEQLSIFTLAVFGTDTKVVCGGRDSKLELWHVPYQDEVECSGSNMSRGRQQHSTRADGRRVRSKSRSRSSSRSRSLSLIPSLSRSQAPQTPVAEVIFESSVCSATYPEMKATSAENRPTGSEPLKENCLSGHC
jgi:WD40 repeat protein